MASSYKVFSLAVPIMHSGFPGKDMLFRKATLYRVTTPISDYCLILIIEDERFSYFGCSQPDLICARLQVRTSIQVLSGKLADYKHKILYRSVRPQLPEKWAWLPCTFYKLSAVVLSEVL